MLRLCGTIQIPIDEGDDIDFVTKKYTFVALHMFYPASPLILLLCTACSFAPHADDERACISVKFLKFARHKIALILAYTSGD